MKLNRKIKLIVFLCAFISVFSISTKIVFANDNVEWVFDKKEELQAPNKVWGITFTTVLDRNTINSKNIYILDSNNNKIDNIELKYEEDKKLVKVIPTKEYEQGKIYYLCIEKGLKSIEGQAITNSHKLEFKIKVVDADFFKVRDIECISNNMINVYFTQPINEDVKLPLYYEIFRNGESFIRGSYQTIEIKTIDGCNNGISIYLKNNILNNQDEYYLKIFGDLMSDFGCRLLNGTGQEISFAGSDKEYEEINVVDTEIINETTIRVTLNNSADKETLNSLQNYSLKEANGLPKIINKVTANKDSKSVNLSITEKLKNSCEYELAVKGIKDSFNASTIKADKYKILWDSSVKRELYIIDAVAVDNKTINVYFNQNLNKDNLTTTSLYKISGVEEPYFVDTPNKAYYNEEQAPNMVKLYLNKELKANKNYKLVVSPYLRDEFGNSVPSNEHYQFMGSSEKHVGTYVEDALIIGNEQIKLTFNEPIFTGNTNLDTNNYTLECNQGDNRKVIITCSNVKLVNENTLILKFENLDFNENYSLKINPLVLNSLMNEAAGSTNIYSNGISVTLGQE